MVAVRFGIYLVCLDPTIGHEMKKTRPCIVVSPDEMNQAIRTVIIAPMTTRTHAYPTRIPLEFEGKSGEIVLDQLRTVDSARLIRRLGSLEAKTGAKVLACLQEMFSL